MIKKGSWQTNNQQVNILMSCDMTSVSRSMIGWCLYSQHKCFHALWRKKKSCRFFRCVLFTFTVSESTHAKKQQSEQNIDMQINDMKT